MQSDYGQRLYISQISKYLTISWRSAPLFNLTLQAARQTARLCCSVALLLSGSASAVDAGADDFRFVKGAKHSSLTIFPKKAHTNTHLSRSCWPGRLASWASSLSAPVLARLQLSQTSPKAGDMCRPFLRRNSKSGFQELSQPPVIPVSMLFLCLFFFFLTKTRCVRAQKHWSTLQ